MKILINFEFHWIQKKKLSYISSKFCNHASNTKLEIKVCSSICSSVIEIALENYYYLSLQ